MTGNPTNIIMVDDDKDDIFLTRTYLNKSGAPIKFTGLTSADELFLYIKNHGTGAIDILLLDLNMPRVNGISVLKTLQGYPHFEDLNIIIYSTSNHPEDRKTCLNLGAKDYIVKPATLSGMQVFINKFLLSLPENLSASMANSVA